MTPEVPSCDWTVERQRPIIRYRNGMYQLLDLSLNPTREWPTPGGRRRGAARGAAQRSGRARRAGRRAEARKKKSGTTRVGWGVNYHSLSRTRQSRLFRQTCSWVPHTAVWEWHATHALCTNKLNNDENEKEHHGHALKTGEVYLISPYNHIHIETRQASHVVHKCTD